MRTRWFSSLQHEAHLWLATPEPLGRRQIEADLALLSDEEQGRFARYIRDADKHLFLAAHVLMRRTLAKYLGVGPAECKIVTDAHGRPEVVGQPVRFNISHVDALVACLVTARADCGIDVEHFAHVDDLMAVAEVTFTAEECEELRDLSGDARRLRFFQTWVLKEAYVKARGLGLALPLDSFRFKLERFDAAKPTAIEFSSNDEEQPADHWQFELIRPSDDHVAAVALGLQGSSRLNLVRCSSND